MPAPAEIPPRLAPFLVIGGGPAGLFAAEHLAGAGHRVIVADRMPSLARKFLMAGRGGLNLTHAEPFDRFLARYAEADAVTRAVASFPPAALRAWADGLGAETFVGSSGRVFPRVMKASPLLRAWLARLDGLGVEFRLRHDWQGWDAAGRARFATPAGEVAIEAAAIILALGGASWPRLGADGGWRAILAGRGVAIAPLEPTNAGVLVDWPPAFAERFAGTPMKRIAISLGGRRVRGEAVVTRRGLEGGAVYALGSAIREALARGDAGLVLDLRPDLEAGALAARLARPGRKGDSLSNRLRKALDLPPVAIALLQEAARRDGITLGAVPAEELARRIKASPLPLAGMAGLDRAISTAGGIRLNELDDGFMLRRLPGVFAAGEMLDWEAPTGGYLLQACFATGLAAAEGAVRWAGQSSSLRGATRRSNPEEDTA